jgi:mono/diheme cytochrome c family protein
MPSSEGWGALFKDITLRARHNRSDMAVLQKRGVNFRGLTLAAMACGVAAAAVLWFVTRPQVVPAAALPPYTPNLANGKTMFDIGGCSSCHAVPNDDPTKVDRLRLGGGLALKSPFGTFYVPNISPDANDGIGAWSEADFVTALWKGTAKDGENLFPAFPYTSYQHMRLNDVRDLFAYLKTLPAVAGKSRPHDLGFPFNQRELVGGWKLLFLHGGPFTPDPTKSPQWNRGAYLVNGPGHCAECHSPRDFLGAIVERERFAGGRAPDGKGWVPNITPLELREDGKPWTEKEIASFLGDGMTPDGDFAGGPMAEVIDNTALLSAEDRAAMATYIAALPPVEGPPKPPKKPTED